MKRTDSSAKALKKLLAPARDPHHGYLNVRTKAEMRRPPPKPSRPGVAQRVADYVSGYDPFVHQHKRSHFSHPAQRSGGFGHPPDRTLPFALPKARRR